MQSLSRGLELNQRSPGYACQLQLTLPPQKEEFVVWTIPCRLRRPCRLVSTSSGHKNFMGPA